MEPFEKNCCSSLVGCVMLSDLIPSLGDWGILQRGKDLRG